MNELNDQLNVILPVYNERESIEQVLAEWKLALDTLKLKYHFIICEDGSIDGTKELLLSIKDKYNLILNSKEGRRGYGVAMMDGINTSRSEYILCIDSDGQYDPSNLNEFWDKRDMADVLIGWRTQRADMVRRKIYSFLFRSVYKMLFPNKIHDANCFVCFRREKVLPNVKYLNYLNEGFWYGFVAMCVKKKLTVCEIPIKHRKRIKGDTQVYKISKVPFIAFRNLIGLIKLKFAK
jgi:dolichol-phosphate mannosyltransferase